MMLIRSSLLVAAGLCLGTDARAQISQDDCAGVLDSVGPGTYAYDTSAASTGAEGQNELACEFFASRVVSSDVWFEYVAVADGNATIATCATAGTHQDSKLAAYPGSGCPTDGTALACADDTCGLFSSITFPVTAGSSYTIQLGSFPGAPGGTGDVVITEDGMPPMNPTLTNQDECSTAEFDTLAGEGTWAWDNSAATTGAEGQSETNCYVLGTAAIANDVWFTWRPEVSGTATIATCNPVSGTVSDTRLAVYPAGACPANDTSIACSDDDCGGGFLSSVTFAATLGECYLVQLGTFPNATPGTGEVAISMVANPPTPIQNLDDCAAAGGDVQIGGGVFAADLTGATTGTHGQSESLCYAFSTSGIENDIWFTWFATQTGLVTIDTCTSAAGDSKLAVYLAQGCPVPGRSIACNDDTCGTLSSVVFPTVAGAGYLVQLGNTPGGSGTAFDVTIIEAGGPGDLGVKYCPNTPNSTGVSGEIEARGSLDVTVNEFFLTATLLPCDEFAYFLSASDMGLINNPGGSAGNFCLGGDSNFIGRFVSQAQNSGAVGAVTIRVDLNAVPIPVAPDSIPMLPGDTWYFQCWFRNDGGSNFTSATCVTFE